MSETKDRQKSYLAAAEAPHAVPVPAPVRAADPRLVVRALVVAEIALPKHASALAVELLVCGLLEHPAISIVPAIIATHFLMSFDPRIRTKL